MVEEDLVLVGASGLVIYDQDCTRGKLFCPIFCYPLQGGGCFVNIVNKKLTSQGFVPFFQKNIFHPWLPQWLQSFGLKYTCLKRYVLSPQLAEAASPMLLKKSC